jgi:5'(3')-deoxyribonucleotidase
VSRSAVFLLLSARLAGQLLPLGKSYRAVLTQSSSPTIEFVGRRHAWTGAPRFSTSTNLPMAMGDLRTIAVDLDDTLNNFTQTLLKRRFAYHERYAVAPATFDAYLDRLRTQPHAVEELLSTEFAYFRAKIHLECYRLAEARPDGIAFMRWLKSEGWRIVICTQRDLRTSYEATRAWLMDNGIPFDYIFRAGNKIVFCKLWGIDILVDDNLFNIQYGGRHGIRVFYPITDDNRQVECQGARAFETYDQVKLWIAV